MSESDIRAAFDRTLEQCDQDQDGVLSFREFALAMETLNMDWSLDELKKVFKSIDGNKDKRIDFEEFRAGIAEMGGGVNLEDFWIRLLTGEVPQEEEKEEHELTIEEIQGLLKDKTGDWQERIRAMEQLVKTTSSMSDEEWAKDFEQWLEPLAVQVNDRRSKVSCAASANLGKISVMRKDAFRQFVGFWMPQLMQVIRLVGVKVMSQAAHQCGKVIVNNVRDSEDDHAVLDALMTSVTDPAGKKYKQLARSAFEYLSDILEAMANDDKRIPTNEEYMNKIEQLVALGIQSTDALARNKAFNCLAFVSFVDEERCTNIMDQMSKAVKKKFTRVKQSVLETKMSGSVVWSQAESNKDGIASVVEGGGRVAHL